MHVEFALWCFDYGLLASVCEKKSVGSKMVDKIGITSLYLHSSHVATSRTACENVYSEHRSILPSGKVYCF